MNPYFFIQQGTVDIPPKVLYDELDRNIEHVPTWNPTLLECRTLKVNNALEVNIRVIVKLFHSCEFAGCKRQGFH